MGFYSWTNGLRRIIKADSWTHRAIATGLLAYTKLHGKKVLYSPQSKKHLRFLESLV